MFNQCCNYAEEDRNDALDSSFGPSRTQGQVTTQDQVVQPSNSSPTTIGQRAEITVVPPQSQTSRRTLLQGQTSPIRFSERTISPKVDYVSERADSPTTKNFIPAPPVPDIPFPRGFVPSIISPPLVIPPEVIDVVGIPAEQRIQLVGSSISSLSPKGYRLFSKSPPGTFTTLSPTSLPQFRLRPESTFRKDSISGSPRSVVTPYLNPRKVEQFSAGIRPILKAEHQSISPPTKPTYPPYRSVPSNPGSSSKQIIGKTQPSISPQKPIVATGSINQQPVVQREERVSGLQKEQASLSQSPIKAPALPVHYIIHSKESVETQKTISPQGSEQTSLSPQPRGQNVASSSVRDPTSELQKLLPKPVGVSSETAPQTSYREVNPNVSAAFLYKTHRELDRRGPDQVDSKGSSFDLSLKPVLPKSDSTHSETLPVGPETIPVFAARQSPANRIVSLQSEPNRVGSSQSPTSRIASAQVVSSSQSASGHEVASPSQLASQTSPSEPTTQSVLSLIAANVIDQSSSAAHDPEIVPDSSSAKQAPELISYSARSDVPEISGNIELSSKKPDQSSTGNQQSNLQRPSSPIFRHQVSTTGNNPPGNSAAASSPGIDQPTSPRISPHRTIAPSAGKQDSSPRQKSSIVSPKSELVIIRTQEGREEPRSSRASSPIKAHDSFWSNVVQGKPGSPVSDCSSPSLTHSQASGHQLSGRQNTAQQTTVEEEKTEAQPDQEFHVFAGYQELDTAAIRLIRNQAAKVSPVPLIQNRVIVDPESDPEPVADEFETGVDQEFAQPIAQEFARAQEFVERTQAFDDGRDITKPSSPVVYQRLGLQSVNLLAGSPLSYPILGLQPVTESKPLVQSVTRAQHYQSGTSRSPGVRQRFHQASQSPIARQSFHQTQSPFARQSFHQTVQSPTARQSFLSLSPSARQSIHETPIVKRESVVQSQTSDFQVQSPVVPRRSVSQLLPQTLLPRLSEKVASSISQQRVTLVASPGDRQSILSPAGRQPVVQQPVSPVVKQSVSPVVQQAGSPLAGHPTLSPVLARPSVFSGPQHIGSPAGQQSTVARQSVSPVVQQQGSFLVGQPTLPGQPRQSVSPVAPQPLATQSALVPFVKQARSLASPPPGRRSVAVSPAPGLQPSAPVTIAPSSDVATLISTNTANKLPGESPSQTAFSPSPADYNRSATVEDIAFGDFIIDRRTSGADNQPEYVPRAISGVARTSVAPRASEASQWLTEDDCTYSTGFDSFRTMDDQNKNDAAAVGTPKTQHFSASIQSPGVGFQSPVRQSSLLGAAPIFNSGGKPSIVGSGMGTNRPVAKSPMIVQSPSSPVGLSKLRASLRGLASAMETLKQGSGAEAMAEGREPSVHEEIRRDGRFNINRPRTGEDSGASDLALATQHSPSKASSTAKSSGIVAGRPTLRQTVSVGTAFKSSPGVGQSAMSGTGGGLIKTNLLGRSTTLPGFSSGMLTTVTTSQKAAPEKATASDNPVKAATPTAAAFSTPTAHVPPDNPSSSQSARTSVNKPQSARSSTSDTRPSMIINSQNSGSLSARRSFLLGNDFVPQATLLTKIGIPKPTKKTDEKDEGAGGAATGSQSERVTSAGLGSAAATSSSTATSTTTPTRRQSVPGAVPSQATGTDFAVGSSTMRPLGLNKIGWGAKPAPFRASQNAAKRGSILGDISISQKSSGSQSLQKSAGTESGLSSGGRASAAQAEARISPEDSAVSEVSIENLSDHIQKQLSADIFTTGELEGNRGKDSAEEEPPEQMNSRPPSPGTTPRQNSARGLQTSTSGLQNTTTELQSLNRSQASVRSSAMRGEAMGVDGDDSYSGPLDSQSAANSERRPRQSASSNRSQSPLEAKTGSSKSSRRQQSPADSGRAAQTQSNEDLQTATDKSPSVRMSNSAVPRSDITNESLLNDTRISGSSLHMRPDGTVVVSESALRSVRSNPGSTVIVDNYTAVSESGATQTNLQSTEMQNSRLDGSGMRNSSPSSGQKGSGKRQFIAQDQSPNNNSARSSSPPRTLFVASKNTVGVDGTAGSVVIQRVGAEDGVDVILIDEDTNLVVSPLKSANLTSNINDAISQTSASLVRDIRSIVQGGSDVAVGDVSPANAAASVVSPTNAMSGTVLNDAETVITESPRWASPRSLTAYDQKRAGKLPQQPNQQSLQQSTMAEESTTAFIVPTVSSDDPDLLELKAQWSGGFNFSPRRNITFEKRTGYTPMQSPRRDGSYSPGREVYKSKNTSKASFQESTRNLFNESAISEVNTGTAIDMNVSDANLSLVEHLGAGSPGNRIEWRNGSDSVSAPGNEIVSETSISSPYIGEQSFIQPPPVAVQTFVKPKIEDDDPDLQALKSAWVPFQSRPLQSNARQKGEQVVVRHGDVSSPYKNRRNQTPNNQQRRPSSQHRRPPSEGSHNAALVSNVSRTNSGATRVRPPRYDYSRGNVRSKSMDPHGSPKKRAKPSGKKKATASPYMFWPQTPFNTTQKEYDEELPQFTAHSSLIVATESEVQASGDFVFYREVASSSSSAVGASGSAAVERSKTFPFTDTTFSNLESKEDIELDSLSQDLIKKRNTENLADSPPSQVTAESRDVSTTVDETKKDDATRIDKSRSKQGEDGGEGNAKANDKTSVSSKEDEKQREHKSNTEDADKASENVLSNLLSNSVFSTSGIEQAKDSFQDSPILLSATDAKSSPKLVPSPATDHKKVRETSPNFILSTSKEVREAEETVRTLRRSRSVGDYNSLWLKREENSDESILIPQGDFSSKDPQCDTSFTTTTPDIGAGDSGARRNSNGRNSNVGRYSNKISNSRISVSGHGAVSRSSPDSVCSSPFLVNGSAQPQSQSYVRIKKSPNTILSPPLSKTNHTGVPRPGSGKMQAVRANHQLAKSLNYSYPNALSVFRPPARSSTNSSVLGNSQRATMAYSQVSRQRNSVPVGQLSDLAHQRRQGSMTLTQIRQLQATERRRKLDLAHENIVRNRAAQQDAKREKIAKVKDQQGRSRSLGGSRLHRERQNVSEIRGSSANRVFFPWTNRDATSATDSVSSRR